MVHPPNAVRQTQYYLLHSFRQTNRAEGLGLLLQIQLPLFLCFHLMANYHS